MRLFKCVFREFLFTAFVFFHLFDPISWHAAIMGGGQPSPPRALAPDLEAVARACFQSAEMLFNELDADRCALIHGSS